MTKSEWIVIALSCAMMLIAFGIFLGHAMSTVVVTKCAVDALLPDLNTMLITNDSIISQLTK